MAPDAAGIERGRLSTTAVATGETTMPRYLIERSFPDGLEIPMTPQGARACLGVVGRNAEDGVTWVHSYVTPDKKKTFCIYDSLTPEAIRRVAQRNGLPV